MTWMRIQIAQVYRKFEIYTPYSYFMLLYAEILCSFQHSTEEAQSGENMDQTFGSIQEGLYFCPD